MAKQRQLKKSSQSLSNFASVFHYGREKVTINDWMQAWRIAESPVMPRTYPLMEVYDMVLIDAEVITAINNRKNKVLGEPFLVLDKEGVYQDAATKQLKGTWFDDFVNAVLDTEFFGYSLIELGKDLKPDYSLKEVNTVERRNIIPGQKLVLPYPFSSYQEGIDFTTDYLNRWYIFTQSKRYPLGLLLYATPYAVLSRDALVKHADYNRDYGKPYKIVYTDKEGSERQDVLASLQNVEEELNGVFDSDEKIDIAFPGGAGGMVDTFDRMDEKAGKKLLKIIQGHVKLSNDTEGAQTYMNKDSIAKTPSEEIKEYDMARVEGVVNEELFPRLLDFNYKLDGHSFIYLDTYLRELQRQKKTISETALELALNHFEVSAKTFEEATGIKVKTKATLPVEENKSTIAKNNKKEGNPETGNQVDTNNLEDIQNREFFKHGAITLPIADKELWADILPKPDANDLYINPAKEIYGYEDSPHITALYGLHPDGIKVNQVKELFQDKAYKNGIEVWLTGISVFDSNEDYDVLKFDVASPTLMLLNAELKAGLVHADPHPEYLPHATIGFIKKGTADKYVKDEGMTVKLHLDKAQYSDGKGNKTLMDLCN